MHVGLSWPATVQQPCTNGGKCADRFFFKIPFSDFGFRSYCGVYQAFKFLLVLLLSTTPGQHAPYCIVLLLYAN